MDRVDVRIRCIEFAMRRGVDVNSVKAWARELEEFILEVAPKEDAKPVKAGKADKPNSKGPADNQEKTGP